MPDDHLICPDCGGVIGATSDDIKPCTCMPATPKHASPSSGDTEVLAAPESTKTVVEKRCQVCGKDVAGHRRIKDSRGYLCMACAREGKLAAEQGLVSCGECSRRLKPEGLIDYHGVKICRKCYTDHQENSKFKAPPPDLKLHKQHDKESLKMLLIIGGILMLICVLAAFGVIGPGWF